MKAFVLAGGFGIRLREVMHGRPKVLAPVCGRPFLEHVLLYLKREGVTEIVLGVGYLAGYVRDAFGSGRALGVRIQYSEEPRPLGTAGAIKNAAKLLRDDFLVLNGDTFIDIEIAPLLQFHRQREADVTIVASKGFHGRGGQIERDKQGRVVRFEDRTERPRTRGYTNAGVYVFSPRVLRWLKPNERAFVERDLFPLLLAQRQRVFAYTTDRDYIDIGTPERYEQAKRVFAQALDADR